MIQVDYGESFKRQLKRLAKRYRHIKQDLAPIIAALEAGGMPGDQVVGTDYTLYKVRAKNSDSNKGKSGGYRIIYYVVTDTRRILVTIYSKSDQGDIGSSVLNQLLAEINEETI